MILKHLYYIEFQCMVEISYMPLKEQLFEIFGRHKNDSEEFACIVRRKNTIYPYCIGWSML